jgi:Domain of unknown function (DUF4123)
LECQVSSSPQNYQAVAQTLAATLNSMEQPLFAVLDGALFDDLPGILRQADLKHRSLFIKPEDGEFERAGPWLVALVDSSARTLVEALALAQPCAVFWSCAEGEEVLWRHLRSINEILIPDVRYLQTGENGRLAHERVLFRHWDPNALSRMLRQLDAHQYSRLFGPAQSILMNAPAEGGLLRSIKPQDDARAPTGPLTIRAEQLEALDAQSRTTYCAKMSSILRQMAPQETSGMSNDELDERILRYEASGNRMGLSQERSLGIWGYLMLTSGDRFESSPEIRGYLQSKPGTPDENVETLLDQMTRLASSIEKVS